LLFISFINDDQIKTDVDLGEKLFQDKLFSKDFSISCASCHIPEFAFADTVNFSKGVNGRLGLRNTPSAMNMASRSVFFFDGRAATLEDQIHFPVEDKNEMAFSMEKAVKRIKKNKVYVSAFKSLYNEMPNIKNTTKAIAAFINSLETSNTLFDNYMNDKMPIMNEAAIRGRTLFMSKKAKCFDCHFSPDFTGDEFKNIGIYDERQFLDKGRYNVTKKIEDLGKFKVPGLRNVAVTSPYMHNGMFQTLEEVVEYYDNPYKFISKPINIDTLLQKPLNLTTEEKSDLVEFLEALTDEKFKSQLHRNKKYKRNNLGYNSDKK
jgi:cytochrome c peroxidase